MKNCASGKRWPSMPMNGIEPPSPIDTGGLPKCVADASSRAASSHGARAGAFQPALAPPASKRTLAP